MNFQEYGQKQNPAILLLHGSGLSWWNYREAAKAICRMRPACRLHRLPDLRHGEFSINHAARYADFIREIVQGG